MRAHSAPTQEPSSSVLPHPQDHFLQEGFFRAGHTVRRTRYLFTGGRMWSTVWSRVDLRAFSFRKSHRKLLRRTLRDFTYEVAPYRRRRDQDELYDAYQRHHPLEVGESVREVLGTEYPQSAAFRTHVLRVTDLEGRLAAFSCFDVGAGTLASLFAAYRPELARRSLGYFTMLAEMEHGRTAGIRHYHPGYCVPGQAAFAYKLRLPDLEGRTFLSEEWRPMDDYLAAELPHEILWDRTEALAAELTRLGIGHEVRHAPLHEIVPRGNPDFGPAPLPYGIELALPAGLGEAFVGYVPERRRYECYFGQAVADLRFEPDYDGLAEQLPADSDLRLFEARALVYTAADEAVAALATHLAPEPLAAQVVRVAPVWNAQREG